MIFSPWHSETESNINLNRQKTWKEKVFERMHRENEWKPHSWAENFQRIYSNLTNCKKYPEDGKIKKKVQNKTTQLKIQ